MKAIIHWADGEHPTTCPVEIHEPAPNGATKYKLKFERRQYRIMLNKDGSMFTRLYGPGSERLRITLTT